MRFKKDFLSHNTKYNINNIKQLNWNYGVNVCIINNNGCIKKNKYIVMGLLFSHCVEADCGLDILWYRIMHKHKQSLFPDKAAKLYTSAGVLNKQTRLWSEESLRLQTQLLTAPLPAELLQFELKGVEKQSWFSAVRGIRTNTLSQFHSTGKYTLGILFTFRSFFGGIFQLLFDSLTVDADRKHEERNRALHRTKVPCQVQTKDIVVIWHVHEPLGLPVHCCSVLLRVLVATCELQL